MIPLSSPAAISFAAWTSCALTTSHQVLCWGNNMYGQLGNGTTTSSSVPALVVWP